jgi:fatty-acyl-CoA synthase
LVDNWKDFFTTIPIINQYPLLPDYLGKVTPEDLKQFMKQSAAEGKIPKYSVPEKYVFTDSIPKTGVGKLNKKVLRKDYSK